jgi:N-acetylglucosamine-6-phosphate deacetylase
LRFAATNPARFIGLGHALGRLAPGYRADMVAFEPGSINILATWVAGAGVRDETAAIGIATLENPGSGLNLS